MSRMSKDTIYRQDVIDVARKCSVKEVTPAYILIDKAEVMTELMMLPSAQVEYTKNEEKVLVMMFTIVENILDLQDGYMNIDDTSFGHNELFNLSEKLGIDY